MTQADIIHIFLGAVVILQVLGGALYLRNPERVEIACRKFFLG